jgi:hypothetical protein
MHSTFEHGAFLPAGEKQRMPRKVVILHGLGGIGKSSIALEYSYRYSASYTAVFWADATTEASLFQAARGIAEHLVSHYASQGISYGEIATFLRLGGLLGRDGEIMAVEAKEGQVAGRMNEWLAIEGNGRWLLVLDNYDDIGAINIHHLLPTCDAGHVIITSRRSNLQQVGTPLEIDEIDQQSGISLLLKCANRGEADKGGKYGYQAVSE